MVWLGGFGVTLISEFFTSSSALRPAAVEAFVAAFGEDQGFATGGALDFEGGAGGQGDVLGAGGKGRGGGQGRFGHRGGVARLRGGLGSTDSRASGGDFAVTVAVGLGLAVAVALSLGVAVGLGLGGAVTVRVAVAVGVAVTVGLGFRGGATLCGRLRAG